ncbi:MAG: helix-turn-helix transcriptional regulator [Bacilli bacterium]
MTIGETLKEKRTENKLTQEQLSEKILVSRKTISNWETGKTTPDIDSLIRLANLFDLSLDNLLLEGSEVVENIKNNLEIKTLKGVRTANIGISICVVMIVFITNLSDVSYTFLILTVLIAASNLIVAFYIDGRIKKLRPAKKPSELF